MCDHHEKRPRRSNPPPSQVRCGAIGPIGRPDVQEGYQRLPAQGLPRFTAEMLNLAKSKHMSDDVRVVSTIGSSMREQGIGVAELRRRLGARGITVSRGALDRLVSERPLKSVNFDLLLPVLDELGITLGEPFVAVPADELARTEEAAHRARSATRALANGAHAGKIAAMLDEADHDDAATIDHLEERLRREHPEAFDKRGRLRKRALSRALVARFGGRRLTKEQVDDVIAAGREAAARRRAAS